ncbi:hypothetical protein ACFV84_37390 [Kitasatospora sp. NPDC059811]|uniref:hypothetical protein n=1 Tax=Streptomycetaceae TaxID=2062 RepID=UPI000B048CF3|nr:hypothetical protein [Streptomyces sp. MJM8645]
MGFDHVDAVMAVPDEPNQFWVFSNTDHRRVEITVDTRACGPVPLSEWEGLTKG